MGMNATDTYVAFEFIRKHFFPRWDVKRQWKIEYIERFGDEFYEGSFDRKNKTLRIFPAVMTDERELKTLLIHEICHCYSPYHGLIWQTAMKKKAKIAQNIEDDALAKAIINNVKREDLDRKVHKILKWSKDRCLYDELNDLIEKYSLLSFRKIINLISREYCMSPSEFTKRYKYCKIIYEYAQKCKEQNVGK